MPPRRMERRRICQSAIYAAAENALPQNMPPRNMPFRNIASGAFSPYIDTIEHGAFTEMVIAENGA